VAVLSFQRFAIDGSVPYPCIGSLSFDEHLSTRDAHYVVSSVSLTGWLLLPWLAMAAADPYRAVGWWGAEISIAIKKRSSGLAMQ
jgi:hypothetical protein